MKRSLAATAWKMCLLAVGALCAAANAADIPDKDLVWIDGSQLPLEGRGHKGEGGDLYKRLPASVREKPDISSIKDMGKSAAGINFRFKTDSDLLRVRWSLPRNPPFGWGSVNSLAAAGVDVYSWFSGHGWQFWFNKAPTGRTNTMDVVWRPGRACTVYLPTFSEIESFSIGIKKGKTISKARPHAVGKPVVVYGTSMVNGFSSSRPGLLWTSILGRLIDAEIINQGYSGNGKMEDSMVDFMAGIDAAAYCFLNCGEQFPLETMQKVFPPFIERLHRLRPSVPIVLGEYYYLHGPYAYSFSNKKRDYIADLVAEFKESDREFWKNLYIVRMEDMLTSDASVDTAHLSDIGAKQMAEAFASVLRHALDLQ